MGEIRYSYNILVGQPKWKRPLTRRKQRWEDNIKMGHKETGCEGMD
jgi:hypothetical protein